MRRLLLVSCIMSLLFAGSAHSTTQADILFTPLSGKGCKTISTDSETGSTTERCAGVAGFSLLVHSDDERASIDVLAPGRQAFELNYWEVVTLGFSSVTGNAEWHLAGRAGKRQPIGLVVRLNTLDQSDLAHPKHHALYVTSTIAKHAACVIFKIDAALPGAQAAARKAARNPNRACLAPVQPN